MPLKFLKSPKKKVSPLKLLSKQLPGVPVSAKACLVLVCWVTKNFLATPRHIITPKLFNLLSLTYPKVAIFTILPKSGPYLAHFAPVPSGPGGARDPNFFFKVGNRPQEAMQKKILEFSPPISDICLLPHFWNKLNLQFSELNITPSVRPNLGIFKNF